jgi:hypothetical protein
MAGKCCVGILISEPLQIPVFNTATGVQMGTIVLQLRVATNTTPAGSTHIVPSTGGLVSLVGLDTLMEATTHVGL